MPPKRRMLVPMIFAVCCGTIFPAIAAEPTTVALTMIRPADAKKDQSLAENLLSLVELAVQTDKSLAIVERRQIDLAISEFILDTSRPGKSQLELGKLITADFLVMLEQLPPDKDSQHPWVRLRLVDPKTAAIRGVTVASFDETTLEETADQFARYVSAVIRSPQQPTVTVAVLPFESKGRFDRLRPLELGIRDLVTARLLALSGVAPVEPASADGEKPNGGPGSHTVAATPRFQVVQRSNMDQLLRELDLIRSGLVDKSRLPEQLPPRGAAYVVRGEIDERQEGDKYTIIVRGELIQASTARVVDTFQFESLDQELETRLAGQIDQIGERLSKDAEIGPPAHVEGTLEVESLKQMTLTELRRIRRFDPLLKHDLFFHLPGQNRYVAARGVEKRAARPVLLLHLLRKSIDRLESILFIRPNDAEAAYALGFCYSIHEPDIYRPDRADEMLRKTFSLVPHTWLGSLSLDYLAQLDFDDRSGKLISGQRSQAIERLWFAFVNKPVEYYDETWVLLRCLGKLHQSPKQNQALADLIEEAAPYAENAPPGDRKNMGMQVQELAIQLVRQAANESPLKAKGLDLLSQWADGDDQELAFWGRKGLTTLAADQKDFFATAEALEQSAAQIAVLSSPQERDRHDAQLIEAAKMYRMGGDAQRALNLLQSFEIRFPTERVKKPGDLLGMHEYEAGRCYEALNEPEKALATYLHAVEINPTIASASDITKRVALLGGVPLDKNRDVDVKYYPYHPNDRRPKNASVHLASHGHKLYVAGNPGVRAFDVASESWQPTSFPSAEVTCIQQQNGQLFVGTKSDGLWECDLASGQWQRVCPIDRLPDPHVVSMTIDGHDIYLGVGTKSSGGLVKIDVDRNIHVFDEPNAPPMAPTHIVVAKHRILACTAEEIYEWPMITEAWLRRDSGKLTRFGAPALFAGRSATWASGKERELVKWQASDKENERFQAAWCTPANNAGTYVHFEQHGYSVWFLTEHGDEVWFGGQFWAPFVSSGLYRFRLKTGEFHKFSPADGFQASNYHSAYDGLWLDDRLWLTTHDGLCVVTPIQSPHLDRGGGE